MKRIHLLLAFFCCICWSLSAQQQQKDLRSKNPFVFNEFKDAKVLQTFGRSTKAKANILLKNASLCFMQDDKIMEAYTQNVIGVEFDSVKYMKVNDMMGRVVASKGYNHLLCVTTVDMAKYKAETEGGDNLPFLEITDVGAFFEIDGEKFEFDKGLPLKQKYYFLLKGTVVPANETQIKKLVRPEMKKAFKTLMGDRWWSWSDEKSLTQLMPYLPD
ncbi:MAG TPA: hypothetical protein PLN34_06725 [Alloprevotella sp.]|nr:hypothetical protein [Alloprevotella sp.]